MTEGASCTVSRAPARLATGVAGLDAVLDGGLLRGGLYLLTGRPGAGKTTLGNHLAYGQAAVGDVAVYATVLAETHERMLTHLTGFAFFAPEQVAHRIHYVSLYDELSANGLGGALTLLRRLAREHRASLLVVDGASLFDDFAPSRLEFRRFTSEVHAQLAALGCTTLLLIDDDGGAGVQSIEFQVDGIIALEDQRVGPRDVRLLRVNKLRGANPLRGGHEFAITGAGIEVFPRLEAVSARGGEVPGAGGLQMRQAFGVRGLDDMLGGGLPAGATTLLLGLPGTGKTIAGLHFVVEGARRGERGIIATFDESPPRLIAKAVALGLDLGAHVAAGTVRILWHLPLDLSLDAWAQQLRTEIGAHAPRRLFVDSASNLERMALVPERLPGFLTALNHELRIREVGALFAAEAGPLVGAEIEVPPRSFPAIVETVILLRYVELRSELHRLISILKVRDSTQDTSLRKFVISPHGIEVADPFDSAEAVLTGVARLIPPTGEAGGAPTTRRTSAGGDQS